MTQVQSHLTLVWVHLDVQIHKPLSMTMSSLRIESLEAARIIQVWVKASQIWLKVENELYFYVKSMVDFIIEVV